MDYSQGILKRVELSRTEHNTRVLKEAKQALLMYAYRYPTTALVFNGTSRGPGRLPCPDTNNSGTPNSSSFCINIDALVGRFPWNANGMEFYDAKGADGESLWYAVSQNFANTGPPKINSDTDGTITLVDQSENIIYDGNGAGIAAIIIAPGPEMAGQNRIGGPNDPANFLDSFNGFDNAVFNNGESDTNDDGFILGPVFDQGQNIFVINDQMIVITAAEVIEMAEKATLQAYRKSINDYLALTGNVYPWLYNYAGVPDVPGLSNYYPVDPAGFATELFTNLDNFGRIPSIFDDYFTETNSQPIESKLDIVFASSYPVSPATVGYDQLTPVVTSGNFQFNFAVAHNFNIQTAGKLTDVRFVDIPDTVGKDGRLTGIVTIPELITRVVFFWDDRDAPSGIWKLCLAGANAAADCNRDSAGNPDPGVNEYDNETPSWILHVVAELDISGTISFDTDYTNAPVIAAPTPASNTGHARISATYAGVDLIDGPYSIRYEIDRNYDTSFDIQETGLLETDDLDFSPLILGMRYYPELPEWVFDNGWQDSIMMAYAANYRPGSLTPPPCTVGADCIRINNLAGNNDNKISILTIAGQHDWDDDLADGFGNDIDDVFDDENADIGDVDGTEYLFDRREQGGNDKILVIEEI